MKIRSITYFCNPKYPLDEKVIQTAGEFLTKARSAYEAAGYEVQTVRLATVPFPLLLRSNDFGRARTRATDPRGVRRRGEPAPRGGVATLREVATTEDLDQLPKLAEGLEKLIQQLGIGYASLGPALPGSPRSYEVIPEALAASQNIFFGGVMADRNIGLSPPAVRACAQIIQKASSITPDGFANLRFAALADVQAGAPFFPAAYHDRDEPTFAIATEAADLAVEAFSKQSVDARPWTIDDGRQALIAEIEKHGKALAHVAGDLSRSPTPDSRFPTFGGVDFSLASFPAEAQSLGTAFERLGVPAIGLHGSLAAAALLAESVDRADFPRAGFSGLMLPILEDATLAKRAAQGTLTVKDVLLYSAVCGTGLDTVPLPGDTTADEIVPVLLDLSALALRLDKPLTARLMPVPGKKAGDPTHFDFAFFASSRVMSLDARKLGGALNGDEAFSVKPR